MNGQWSNWSCWQIKLNTAIDFLWHWMIDRERAVQNKALTVTIVFICIFAHYQFFICWTVFILFSFDRLFDLLPTRLWRNSNSILVESKMRATRSWRASCLSYFLGACLKTSCMSSITPLSVSLTIFVSVFLSKKVPSSSNIWLLAFGLCDERRSIDNQNRQVLLENCGISWEERYYYFFRTSKNVFRVICHTPAAPPP